MQRACLSHGPRLPSQASHLWLEALSQETPAQALALVSKDGVAGPLPVQPSLLQEAPAARGAAEGVRVGVSRPPAQAPTARRPGLPQQMTSGWQLGTAGMDCHCPTGTESRCQQGWLPQRIEVRGRSWPPAASGGCQSPSAYGCITGISASGHMVPVSHDCMEVTSITKVISLQEP